MTSRAKQERIGELPKEIAELVKENIKIVLDLED
jgi:hypothetical protein